MPRIRNAFIAASILAVHSGAQPTVQSFSNDHGWAVSIDQNSRRCELSTTFPSDDGQLFILLVPDEASGSVSFALAGDSVRGAPGRLTFVFDGKPLYDGPVQTYQLQSLGARLPHSALAAFKSASRLEIRFDARPVARLVLDGASAAIGKLEACASSMRQ